MADLNVTTNGVIAANSNTVVATGYSAAAINAVSRPGSNSTHVSTMRFSQTGQFGLPKGLACEIWCSM